MLDDVEAVILKLDGQPDIRSAHGEAQAIKQGIVFDELREVHLQQQKSSTRLEC
jgi:hypothetical protein